MTGPVRTPARDTTFIAALILVCLAATAWMRPLMLPDEGRYVGVAWEMLRSGEWLTPTLNGLPYFHKPPLFYWITASALSVFGLNEWAARAAPILGAWTGAFALFLFTKRWCGPAMARVTLVALLAQPLLLLGGQFANLDMLVAGCITATIVLLADAVLSLEKQSPHRWTLAAAFAMAGLGVLAKGLIGFVLPALVIGAWLIAQRRWRALRALLWWPGLLVFLVITAPWFLVMQQRFSGFFDYFFVVQHFKRFATAGFNNMQPAWFYPAVLLLFTLPWWPSLAKLFRRGYLSDPERGAVRWLMLIWAIVVIAFFSMPKSKLIGYVLPAVPPLAFFVADGYSLLSPSQTRARRLWWAGSAIAAVLSLVAVIVVANRPLPSSRALAQAMLTRRAPQEPVFMLNHYHFDLPFYARLAEPVVVVEDWRSPDVDRRDNWRKELADAGNFAPTAAARSLMTPDALVHAICAAPVSWVLGSAQDLTRHPFLASAQAVSAQSGTQLWRVDTLTPAVAQALHCPEKPSGG